MKTVELSDETHAALLRLAAARKVSPEELLTTLIEQAPLTMDSLLAFLGSVEFRALTDPIERYLALLACCATNYPSDFADFISHQESGHRYLMLSREEVQDIR